MTSTTRLFMPIVAAAIAACGGDGGTNPTNYGGPPGGGGSTSNAVTVADNTFTPISTTVSVGVTVTWTWTGSNTHNVTFDNGSGTSGDKTTGTYQRSFSAAGSFGYRCSIHGGAMTGTIIVQ